MKSSADLLSSFDRSWKEFKEAWKQARSKTSEKSIHDLRVKTRRFIAVLELAQSVSAGGDRIPSLQRRFKKVLKRMGPLRDLQVQLETLARIPKAPVIDDFKEKLERRERREIQKIPDELKRETRNRLAKNVKHVLAGLEESKPSPANGRVRQAVERIIVARRNEFRKAERSFQRSQPVNEEAMHDMRIALKKVRYVIEAAAPVLGPGAKQRARELRALQKLMGDSRDLEILRAELETWAQKRGRKIAIVPALERLDEKRQGLIRKIADSSPKLDKLFRAEQRKPISETTRVAGSSIPPALSSPVVSAGRDGHRLKK